MIDSDIKKNRIILLAMGAVLIAAFVMSLSFGRYNIPFFQTVKVLLSKIIPIERSWSDTVATVVFDVRMARTIAAMLVGMSLSCAGATYQGVFRNHLASPDLLGVSAGACVGAAVAILGNMGSIGTQVLALIGGIIAVICSLAIPKLFHDKSAVMLVLAGIIVSGLMNSVLGLLKYMADPDYQLADIVYWTMGSLATVKMVDLLYYSPCILGMILLINLLRWKINILSLDDVQAHSLGVHVSRFRVLVIVCSTLLTASAICLSGTVGWIGLVIPHLCRFFVGNENRYLIPASTLLGGSFLILIDVIARNISGSEIPLGILTGIIGTPVFVGILIHSKRKAK